MVGRHKREARDDDAGERISRQIDSRPDTVGAEENALPILTKGLQHPGAGEPSSLHDQIPSFFCKKFLHPRRHRLHGAVTGEEDKGARLTFRGEMPDPFGQSFLIAGIARFRHFPHKMKLHLALVIERRSKL